MRGLTNAPKQVDDVDTHAATHYADGSDPIDLAKLGAIPASDKGKAGGVAALGEDGKVPSEQLPAPTSVDFNILDNFPTAEVGQLLRVAAVDENGNPTEWEMAEALNPDMSNLDEAADLSGLAAMMGASKVVTGTYTGDGEASRVISLGITPKVVIITAKLYMGYSFTTSKDAPVILTTTRSPLYYSTVHGPLGEIVGDGFKVYYSSDNTQGSGTRNMNNSGLIYHYIVLA